MFKCLSFNFNYFSYFYNYLLIELYTYKMCLGNYTIVWQQQGNAEKALPHGK